MLFIGTYDTKVLVVSLLDLVQLNWRCNFSLDSATITESDAGCAPNSFLFLGNPNSCQLVCGLRNGNIVAFQIHVDIPNDMIEPISIKPMIYKFFNGPIVFRDGVFDGINYVIARDEFFEIRIKGGQLQFEKVGSSRDVRCCAKFPALRNGANSTLAILTQKSLSIRKRTEKRPEPILQAEKLEPQKIIYDDLSNTILVLVLKEKYYYEGPFEIVIKNLDIPDEPNLFAFRLGHCVNCLEVWSIKDGKNFICAGIDVTNYGLPGTGLLQIYRLKHSAKAGYRLSKSCELEFDSPITAIQPFGKYLLATHGSRLILVKIGKESRL